MARVGEDAGKPRVVVGHDAFGLVGHHRRDAAALAEACGWRRHPPAVARRGRRCTSGFGARCEESRRTAPPSQAFAGVDRGAGSLDSATGQPLTHSADATSPGQSMCTGPGRAARGARPKRLRRASAPRRPASARPLHFVIGANSACDRAADARTRRWPRQRWLSVNTRSGARSRNAHATPLTTDAAPGPSVVRHAPGRPVTSACASAASAPPVSVA